MPSTMLETVRWGLWAATAAPGSGGGGNGVSPRSPHLSPRVPVPSNCPSARCAALPARPPCSCTIRAGLFLFFNTALGSYIVGTITLLVVKADERTGSYRERSANLQQYTQVQPECGAALCGGSGGGRAGMEAGRGCAHFSTASECAGSSVT